MVEKEKEEKKINWRTKEYEYHQKNITWYVSIISVIIIIAIIALWQKNFFFLVFILIAGAMLIFLGDKKPKTVNVQIDENEVTIGEDMVYDYEKLEWFSIVHQEGKSDQIVIKTISKINPILKIRIDSKMLPKAKEILSMKLEEEEYEPSLMDIVLDILRF